MFHRRVQKSRLLIQRNTAIENIMFSILLMSIPERIIAGPTHTRDDFNLHTFSRSYKYYPVNFFDATVII